MKSIRIVQDCTTRICTELYDVDVEHVDGAWVYAKISFYPCQQMAMRSHITFLFCNHKGTKIIIIKTLLSTVIVDIEFFERLSRS